MSNIWDKLFGKKGQKAPTPSEAIQKLRETEEMLQKKSEFLEKKMDQELAVARKNASKNKRAALLALKRKKKYEKQLAQLDGTLTTIEFQREALENAESNAEILKTMKYAAASLKNAHVDLDVDKVHDMMDDISEQHELANEISQAISNPVGFGEEYDEDELNAELEELEQEDLDEKLIGVEPLPADLPSVPTKEPVLPAASGKSRKQEDEDLQELQAWAM